MKLSIVKGDITKIKADAIVNAAHNTLMGGGGVDGAIHRNAGVELLRECIQLRNNQLPEGLPTGEAVATKAYNLPAKIIIHTVGPRAYSQNMDLLKNCYINSLRIAEENNCESIAFPAISTGAYGCPIEKSIEILKDVLTNINNPDNSNNLKLNVVKDIILVLFKDEDLAIYQRELIENPKNIPFIV